MKYSSKVDWWLAVLLWLAPAVVLGAGMLAPPSVRLFLFSDLLFMLAIYFGIAIPVRYTMGEQALTVRSGLFLRWVIAYNAIENVEPTRNPLSSPAFSLDRLAIRYSGGRQLLISPKDKAGFVQELQLRSTGMKVIQP